MTTHSTQQKRIRGSVNELAKLVSSMESTTATWNTDRENMVNTTIPAVNGWIATLGQTTVEANKAVAGIVNELQNYRFPAVEYTDFPEGRDLQNLLNQQIAQIKNDLISIPKQVDERQFLEGVEAEIELSMEINRLQQEIVGINETSDTMDSSIGGRVRNELLQETFSLEQEIAREDRPVKPEDFPPAIEIEKTLDQKCVSLDHAIVAVKQQLANKEVRERQQQERRARWSSLLGIPARLFGGFGRKDRGNGRKS